MDTKDEATARVVWKFDVNGLSVSTSGINGNYRMATTNDGQFFSEIITGLKINSEMLESGSILAKHLSVETKEELRDGLVTKEILSSFKADQNGIIQEINQKIDRSTDKTKQLLPDIINQEISRRKSELKGADGAKGDKGERGQDGRTIYTHIAYSDSADGRTNFSTTDSLNKIYSVSYTHLTLPTKRIV